MSTFPVTLGGRTFDVKTLPVKKAKSWRERFSQPLNDLSAQVETIGSVEITSGAQISGFVKTLGNMLVRSPDLIADMLFEYSKELADARDWIEENSTDAEIMLAFTEVLKVAYPLAPLVKTAMSGLGAISTSKKSASPNGDSAPTK